MALPLAAEATAYEQMIFDRQDACDACNGKPACPVWRMAPCGALLRQVGMTCPNGRWPMVSGTEPASFSGGA
jgi:hypothetical protein